MMKVPLVDLKAGFFEIKEEVMNQIEEVFSHMNLFLGSNVQAFEKEFSNFCGVNHGIGVSSGTDAIHLALRACGVCKGDEVITVSHTFFATIEAISYTGARPVFVDIDPKSFTMDVNQIEGKLSEKTKAIIPVHIYGHPVDMDPILEIAKKNNVSVIEDACQAHGAKYKGRICGSMGDIGCFSFYFTKNLGGYGEAGMAVTNNEKLANQLKLYRNHGHVSKFDHAVFGYNNRMDEIQATVLRIKLKHLHNKNTCRINFAQKYNQLLEGLDLITPFKANYAEHVFHLYVIRVKEREKLRNFLSQQGVGTGIHYKIPAHRQPACKNFGINSNHLPETEKACEEILSLPMYPELTNDQTSYVAEKVAEFYSKS